MKSEIKNLALLTDTVSEKDVVKMEHAALDHRRFSNITFKIVEVNPKKIIIQVVQGKSSSGNYFDEKRLREIVHETFDRFFAGRTMHVHAVRYKEPDPSQVNAAWINKMMLDHQVKLKTISDDTGINYSHLSDAISSDQLSAQMKALMWYYFQAKTKQS